MTRVLVLRPEPGAGATVARAHALGLDAVAVPLFEIEPVDWKAPEASGFDALLLTSANAVRFGGGQLQRFRGLKTYAVGEATAAAAREAGFHVVGTGDAGLDGLLESIEPHLKLLHLCGEERREPEHARQEIKAVAVYRSVEIEEPMLRLSADSVALIHSPRAGLRFAELVTERDSVAIAAISCAAAEAVGSGWRAIESAAQPNDQALLALAARLCNNSPPE